MARETPTGRAGTALPTHRARTALPAVRPRSTDPVGPPTPRVVRRLPVWGRGGPAARCGPGDADGTNTGAGS